MVLVLNNEDLNMVSWEQRIMIGDPKFEGSQDLYLFQLCGIRQDAGLGRYPHRKGGGHRTLVTAGLCRRQAGCRRLAVRPGVPPLPPL